MLYDMNKDFKPPQYQNDHMSTEVDRNTFRSANRHKFRAFYNSSDGSWQIKESVQKGYLRDITGISDIVNCNRGNTLCDDLFVNQNIMNKTKNNHKTRTSRVDLVVNKLNQNNQSLSVSSIPGSHINLSPREKKGFSGKRKEHSKRNPSKKLPNKSVTKFIFKDFTPEFDPSQDIFESSTRNGNNYDSEFSSPSKREKSQKTNNDIENTCKKEEIKNSKKKRNNRRNNTPNETRKFNISKLNCVENMNKDNVYLSPQKRQNMEDIVAENLTMLEELVSSGTIDETIVKIVESKKEKLKINNFSQEKEDPLSKKSEHTANSNSNWINLNHVTAFNQDSLVTVSKEIQRKMNGKDSNGGDLNPKMRIDQEAQISINIKQQNLSSGTNDDEEEMSLFEKSQEQRKIKKTMSANVNPKLKSDRMMSIGNSSKHKMSLKSNCSQKMKGNIWIQSPKKQTNIITTNLPTEINESQKQINEENTCNTNLKIALEKDDISSKVTKSHTKEKFKNNMKNINSDSSDEKFPYETDLKTEEIKSPRKKKKHNRDKLKNSNTGEKYLSEEVQDRNEMHIENILTDLKAREDIISGKRKRHSQDKVKRNTDIDVDKQWLCEESQDMFGVDTPNYNDREKSMSTNVNTKLETDRMISFENSNKHKIKLKTNSSKEMKGNSQIEMSEKQNDVISTNTHEKQTDVITTNMPEKQANNVITTITPMENDESQKQINEENTCNTNLNKALEKYEISSKVTKSHMKEKCKNNMKNINSDSSPEKFPTETDLKAEENKNPRKNKKHKRDKLKNSNTGEEHSSEEVQDRNEMRIENMLTDLKARQNITPRKRKRHSQDKVRSSTGIDVDKQWLCEGSQDMFGDDTPNYNDREKFMSTNVNTNSNISFENSNKHNIKLKTKSSQKIKGNSQIGMSRKQKDVIATNTPEKQTDVITSDTPEKQRDVSDTNAPKKETDVITTSTPEKKTDVITTDTPEKQTDVITTDTPEKHTSDTPEKQRDVSDTNAPKKETDVITTSTPEKKTDVINTDTPEKQTYVITTKIPEKQTDVITTDTPEKQTYVITTNTPEKQTDVITTNTPMENDKSQKQIDELKNFNNNLNMQLGKDYINCKVSKSLRKEKFKNNMNDFKGDSLTLTDLKCEENTIPSKRKKHQDKLKNSSGAGRENLYEKVQDGNDTNVENLLTDFETSDTEAIVTPKKRKKHNKDSDISRKNKPLVSSTPFPDNKKRKEHFSELGENSSYRFNYTSENKGNDNSISSNQTILEEIQCKMIASESEMKALKKLKIEIDWELSPLHKIDTGSGKLNASRLRAKLGSKHSKLLDDSKFTEEDENKIKKSWEEFAQTYNFSSPELFFPSEQNFGSFSNTERHHFKLFLAKYLPNRRLLSVYLKFANMYGVKKKGRWSDKEDRLLLDLYFACTRDNSSDGDSKEESQRQPKLGLPMKKIMAKALDRTIMSVVSRLKILLENENAKNLSQKDIIWTPELEGALIHRLLKKSKVDSLEDLRHAMISYKVWRKVVTKLELPLDKVVNHWKYVLYPQLFAHQPVLRHLLQMELIKWFYNSDDRDLKSVDWSDISRRAGDLGSCYLYRVFSTLMYNFVPKDFRKNFRESVTFLHEQYLPKLKKKTTSQMLIRKFYDPDTRTLNFQTEDEEDCVPFRIE